MNDKNFKINLCKDLGSLGDVFIVLLNANSKDYINSVLESLKFITDKGMGGVYLTSARPYGYMTKHFERYDIDTTNLFFIDTISCMAGKSPGEHGKCVFIENPSALEEVGMWVNSLMERIEMKNKILIIDSLSTMQIYNDIGTLTKFSQQLINRLRIRDESGIFTTIDTEIHEGLHNTLASLCDKTIKV